MNLLVTLNSNYIGPLTVMLRSLMVSNPETHFDLYVAHATLTDADFEAIKNNVDLARTLVHPIQVGDEYFKDAPILKRTSKETYFRLLVTEYLPQNVERILYIDPDTVVIKPLDELYHIQFGDMLLAGAGHTIGFVEFLNHRRLHIGKGHPYINAGIMMMNVAGMRKSVTSNMIFDYIRKHRRTLYLADQDVINGLFWNKTIALDPRVYNLDEKTVTFFDIEPTSDWIEKNTVIVHFNGSQKPWKENYKGVLAGYYFKYRDMMPDFTHGSGKRIA